MTRRSDNAPCRLCRYRKRRRRPLTRVQPDGVATFRWLYNGWATTLVDENGHQKVRTQDVLGRLVAGQDYTGTYPSASLFQTTGYAYDVSDLLTGVTDATGQNKTSRVYDSIGRLTSQADPDLGSWSYAYNPIGTRASLTDAKQQKIGYAYDNLDRLTGTSGTGLSVTYSYDSGANVIGRRSQMTDGAGTAGHGFDARGRLASLTRVINGRSYSVSTIYDEQDRALATTYPNGDGLTYWYGDHGQPETMILNANVSLVKEATYTQLSQPATLPLGNGLTTQVHYYALDANPPQPNQWFGRLAQGVTGSVQNESVTSYDGVGNPMGISYADHAFDVHVASRRWIAKRMGVSALRYTANQTRHGALGWHAPLPSRREDTAMVTTLGWRKPPLTKEQANRLFMLTLEDDTEDAPWMVMGDLQFWSASGFAHSLRTYGHEMGLGWYVGGMLPIQFVYPGTFRKRTLAPDVMVAFTPEKPHTSYDVEREGTFPPFILEVVSPTSVARDEEEKLEAYTLLGVREYALFRPKDDAPSTLMGYRREDTDGKDMPMRVWEPDTDGRLWSAVLRLHLEVHGQALQARTPDGRLLLMPEQERLARARAELAQQRAEEALARAQAELARAEAERARAEAEQRQRADEVVRLRRELERYRRQGDHSQ